MRITTWLIGLMLAGGLVFAQQSQGQDSQGQPGPGMRRGAMGPGPMMERMLANLNLTDDQKLKVKPILQEQADKMQALRADTSLDRQTRMQKMRDIQTETDGSLKGVLTDEQYTKLQTMRRQNRQRMMRQGGRRGYSPQQN
jgi:protein CpxP